LGTQHTEPAEEKFCPKFDNKPKVPRHKPSHRHTTRAILSRMNQEVGRFAKYVATDMPKGNKQTAIDATLKNFHLIKDGIIYYCDFFAVRFCYTKNTHFSNTILALSKLQKYDHIPFMVVLIRKGQGNLLYLANTSFLKKISHSSRDLRTNNIKGSFNGTDIIKEYEGIPNDADHIEELFAIHQGFSWTDNLERLVKATTQIKSLKTKFVPDEGQKNNLFASFQRAVDFVCSPDYLDLKEDLDRRVQRRLNLIAVASHIDNTNIRGRLIEYLITTDGDIFPADMADMERNLPASDTKNSLGDYTRRFEHCNTYKDIKTEVMYLSSNPKAYNIDKFLEPKSAIIP